MMVVVCFALFVHGSTTPVTNTPVLFTLLSQGIENNAGIIGALAGVVKGEYGTDAFWQRCQQMAGAVRINPVCGTRWSL